MSLNWCYWDTAVGLVYAVFFHDFGQEEHVFMPVRCDLTFGIRYGSCEQRIDDCFLNSLGGGYKDRRTRSSR